jgi:hypothetical protein
MKLAHEMTLPELEAALTEAVHTSDWWFDDQNWKLSEWWGLRAEELHAEVERRRCVSSH